jgi:hypothetical protein
MSTKSQMRTQPLSRDQFKYYQQMARAGSRQERRAALAKLQRDLSVWKKRVREGRGFAAIDLTTKKVDEDV